MNRRETTTMTGGATTTWGYNDRGEVNSNVLAEGKAHAVADAMWKAYLNAVDDKIGVICGGSRQGTRRVIEETLPVGPIPWR